MSREAFEAWCCKRWASDRGALLIRQDGEYDNGHVQFAWAAWQAAQADAFERAAKVCEGLWYASECADAIHTLAKEAT
jgi:hypothetical protein